MLFADDRHIWSIADPAAIEGSGWIQSDLHGRAGKRNLEFMKKAYTNAAYWPTSPVFHPLVVDIVDNPTAATEATPQDAIKCLQEAVILLVENTSSDGAFFKAMALALDRDRVVDALDKQWLTIAQMGGYGEVEKRAKEEIEKRRVHFRLHVLTDCDAEFPEQQTATMKKVTESCAALNVTFTLLAKRKIENYLPHEVLAGIPRKHKVYMAFLRLTEAQKDHYEMKNGFKRVKGVVQIPPNQRALFDKLPKPVREGLCGGFGGNVSSQFESSQHQITRDGVVARCTRHPTELDGLMDAVERLL
jgi:hypothetical protein